MHYNKSINCGHTQLFAGHRFWPSFSCYLFCVCSIFLLLFFAYYKNAFFPELPACAKQKMEEGVWGFLLKTGKKLKAVKEGAIWR